MESEVEYQTLLQIGGVTQAPSDTDTPPTPVQEATEARVAAQSAGR